MNTIFVIESIYLLYHRAPITPYSDIIGIKE